MLVSGGGWGVGDVAGAVEEALALAEVDAVVCLCGRNEELRAAARRRASRGEPRVRVEGFTEADADWLAAADVLVHSTGGLTVLEACMRGCPAISYGWGRGHVRAQQRAPSAASASPRSSSTRAELRAALERALAARPHGDRRRFGGLPSAASFVLAAADAR